MNEPVKQEVNHQTLKLMVGVIALSLGSITNLFASGPLDSISASYFEGGWSQTIFIGSLFAIAAFLLAYNGYSKAEMVLSKFAGIAAAGVALFPCNCISKGAAVAAAAGQAQCRPEQALIPYVHFIAAAVMFVILVVFCWFFYNRAHEKKDRGSVEAGRRMVVYQVCGATIVIAMVAMAIDALAGSRIPRMVWYGETAGLIAFGISWLTAARVVPLLSKPEERPSALNGPSRQSASTRGFASQGDRFTASRSFEVAVPTSPDTRDAANPSLPEAN